MQMGSGMVASPATGLAANANSQHHKPLRPRATSRRRGRLALHLAPANPSYQIACFSRYQTNPMPTTFKSSPEARRSAPTHNSQLPARTNPAHVKAPVSTHRVHTETHIASAHTPQAFGNHVLLETQLPLRIANMPQSGKKQHERRK